MSFGRVSSEQVHRTNLIAMQMQQGKLNRTMYQVSSGLKYANAGEDPNDMNRLFRLYQQKAAIATYNKSSGIATSQLQQQSSILEQVSNTLSSARSTVVGLNSAVLSPTDAGTLATKLQSILDELVDMANTKVNGKYLFSGSLDRPPIVQDVNGNYLYQGNQEYQYAIIGNDVSIQMNETARDLFFQLPTADLELTGFSGVTSVTATNPGLVNPGVLTASNALIAHELNLNGIDINAASALDDTLSTSDNIASALAITKAINKSYNLTDVTAYYANNVLNFNGGGAYIDHNFVAGELTINGVQIIGDTTPLTNPTVVDRMVALINTNFPGGQVVASNNAGQLCLTSTDGSNLQISSTGASPANLALAGFNFVAGDNKVQRANITLKSENNINIATNSFVTNANAIGFSPGGYNVTANAGTAVMSTPIMRDTAQLANFTEDYIIQFTSPTTYNVYRESDPLTPVSEFKVYHAGQLYNQNATLISNQPATYTSGDNIVVDGVEVSITGVPAAGDTFMISKQPKPSNDIFNELKNAIDAARNYKGQDSRYNYNMNVAIANITYAETNVTNIAGVVGARLERIDIQTKTHSKIDNLVVGDISSIQDVDMAEAISDFSQAKTALQAAQAVTAQTSKLSLFNYI